MEHASLSRAAFEYAVEYGWALFPLHSSRDGRCSCRKPACHSVAKHPRTANGLDDASSHPEQIGEWWDRWPDANIGFVPGSRDLIVVDIDGLEAADVARHLGLLGIDTLRTSTSRGEHEWFTVPDGVTIDNGSPWKRSGIDVRAHKGYVLLPPSVHPSGHVYTWRGSPDAIAPLPDVILQTILSHQQRDETPSAATTAETRIASGQSTAEFEHLRITRYIDEFGQAAVGGRNDAANALTWALFTKIGAGEATAWHYVVEWNKRNPKPLDERELATTFASARRAARGSSAA